MQGLLPAAPSPSKRLLTRTQQQQQPEPWLPGRELCAALSDMREARQKQADVGEALRVCVPRAWWGAQMGNGQPRLGSHLQIIQVPFCHSPSLLLVPGTYCYRKAAVILQHF